MNRGSLYRRVLIWGMAFLTLILGSFFVPSGANAQSTPSQPSSMSSTNAKNSTGSQATVKRQKLVLKDGNIELIREYEIQGDRVRYYNLDSSEWEEIPASLVDWDATKKLAAAEASSDAKLNQEVHYQEEGRLVQPLDIDASLEVAPGIFLPPGEGLFIFDGKNVIPMAEAEIESKLNKKKAVEKVLVPIPIIPSRHTISIHGARAKLRLTLGQTEFYMRTADGREPELNLVRVKIHGDSRDIANVDQMFGEQAASANTLLFQRWQIAKGVYRFTLGQSLEPGEFALIEVIQDSGMNIYVWDFGIDPAPSQGKPTTN
jgi:hypothetical protein